MSDYTVRFRAPGAAPIDVPTKNPAAVISRAFSHDIPKGAFPRWIPFQGQAVEVEVVVNARSGVYVLANGRYSKQ